MQAMKVYLAVVIMMMGCRYASGEQAGTAAAPTVNLPQTVSETPIDLQLEVNRDALLKSTDEQMRINGATLLLKDSDPNARRILIEILGLTNNSAARITICKVLVQAGSTGSIEDKEDFIQPLLGIFATENAEEAKQAAQATAIYKYEEIGQTLERLVADVNATITTRVNVIQALQVQYDMRAAIKLLQLVDDPEKQIADAAEKALTAIGIPYGTSKDERTRTIEVILSKGKDTYLRDLLVTQNAQIQKTNSDLSTWKKSYVELLNKLYTGYDREKANVFLVESLADTRPVVKLWALEKVSQLRQGPGTSTTLPAELGPALTGLISDTDKDVRLKTVELLSSMTGLNPAQDILKQLKVETNEQVKVQLVKTLGTTCYNVLLSQVGLAPEVRDEALVWGEKFLADQDAAKAAIGANVIKYLLEKDGMTQENINKYLNLLSGRYQQIKDNPGSSLRVDLLKAMAVLVAQTSTCRNQAVALFDPVFRQALSDETDLVREAAVTGIINIDNAAALKIFRAPEYTSDPSENIRSQIIKLARDIGTKDDLSWLVEKIGSTSTTEGQSAWQAVLQIFSDLDVQSQNEWMNKLTAPESNNSLTSDQKITLLERVEVKAASENKPEILKTARERLAVLHYNAGKFEQAAGYYNKLYTAVGTTTEEADIILPKLVEAYLRWPKMDMVAEIVKNYLSRADAGPENAIVISIDDYFMNQPAGSDPNVLLNSLSTIQPSEARPKWQEQLRIWAERLNKEDQTN